MGSWGRLGGDLGPPTGTGWSLSHPGLLSQGEALLQKLQQLLDRNVSLAVATSNPTPAKNSTDLQVLESRGGSLPSWAQRELWCCLGVLGARGCKRLRGGFPRGRLQGPDLSFPMGQSRVASVAN